MPATATEKGLMAPGRVWELVPAVVESPALPMLSTWLWFTAIAWAKLSPLGGRGVAVGKCGALGFGGHGEPVSLAQEGECGCGGRQEAGAEVLPQELCLSVL